jgi:hypothetical protein
MTRTDDDRVAHILDAIELIERWTAERPQDDLCRSTVMHQMEIIGDVAKRPTTGEFLALERGETTTISGLRPTRLDAGCRTGCYACTNQRN